MPKGFGEDLWHNVQAVRLDHLGGVQAPVRANGSQGVMVGAAAVSRADAAAPPETAPRGLAAWLRRLTGRA